jgi:hypothetical protein
MLPSAKRKATLEAKGRTKFATAIYYCRRILYAHKMFLVPQATGRAAPKQSPMSRRFPTPWSLPKSPRKGPVTFARQPSGPERNMP